MIDDKTRALAHQFIDGELHGESLKAFLALKDTDPELQSFVDDLLAQRQALQADAPSSSDALNQKLETLVAQTSTQKRVVPRFVYAGGAVAAALLLFALLGPWNPTGWGLVKGIQDQPFSESEAEWLEPKATHETDANQEQMDQEPDTPLDPFPLERKRSLESKDLKAQPAPPKVVPGSPPPADEDRDETLDRQIAFKKEVTTAEPSEQSKISDVAQRKKQNSREDLMADAEQIAEPEAMEEITVEVQSPAPSSASSSPTANLPQDAVNLYANPHVVQDAELDRKAKTLKQSVANRPSEFSIQALPTDEESKQKFLLNATAGTLQCDSLWFSPAEQTLYFAYKDSSQASACVFVAPTNQDPRQWALRSMP